MKAHNCKQEIGKLACADMLVSSAMIVGTGIDIAEVQRIRQAIERFGGRFLRRVFTDDEMRYCDAKANRMERYAARFAAKEAAMKALGTGWNHGIRWRDVEVRRQPGSRPTILFHGKAAELADEVVVVGDTHYGRVEDAQMHILHIMCYAFMEKPDLATA